MVCRCDTPAPFVPGRRRATSRPPGKAVPAPVRRHARARLCGYALGRMRVHTCASGQARGTPPPRGVHSGGAACTYRRGGVTSRRDGDRLFLRPRAAFSPIAAGDSAAGGAKRPQIAKKRAMRANGGARGAAHGTRGRRVRVHAPATRAMRTSVRERTSQAGAKKTRNYLALNGFMPIFAVHKSAAARGGSPPLDSRNSPPLAFIPPSRRRAERGAVLKRTICSSFAIIVFCSVIRLDVRQLQLCYGLLLFSIFRF